MSEQGILPGILGRGLVESMGACHYSATVLAPPTLAPTLQRLPALAPVTLARPEARHGVLAPARSSFQHQDLKKEYKRTQFSIGKTIDGDYYWIKTTT